MRAALATGIGAVMATDAISKEQTMVGDADRQPGIGGMTSITLGTGWNMIHWLTRRIDIVMATGTGSQYLCVIDAAYRRPARREFKMTTAALITG